MLAPGRRWVRLSPCHPRKPTSEYLRPNRPSMCCVRDTSLHLQHTRTWEIHHTSGYSHKSYLNFMTAARTTVYCHFWQIRTYQQLRARKSRWSRAFHMHKRPYLGSWKPRHIFWLPRHCSLRYPNYLRIDLEQRAEL
jgi:hypothetical protein